VEIFLINNDKSLIAYITHDDVGNDDTDADVLTDALL
jgi:hypothetical protein